MHKPYRIIRLLRAWAYLANRKLRQMPPAERQGYLEEIRKTAL